MKQRIIDTLTAEFPNGLTHADLATRLDAPEPSVRRTLQALRRAGTVEFWRYADSSGTDMLFRVRPPQVTQ